jgi:8-oxo-dGTP diphosphatase
MSPDPINESFVRGQIDRLQSEYGDVPVEDEVHEIPGSELSEYVENARSGYVGSAYAWVTRRPEQAAERSETYSGGVENRERALLILPRGRSAWGVPGGGVEGDESFEQAAVREVAEEAGVDCEITGLWHLQHARWRSEDDSDERVSHTLHVFFNGEYAGGSIRVQGGEVNGAAWFAERPDDLIHPTQERATEFF